MAKRKVETQVVINRPIEDVFAYVIDLNNLTQWDTGVLEAEYTSEDPIGVGTTYRHVIQFLGRRLETEGKVIEFEPNKKISYKSESGPGSGEVYIAFETTNGDTRVTQRIKAEFGGLFKLAEPIVFRSMQRQNEASLATLKDILEAET